MIATLVALAGGATAGWLLARSLHIHTATALANRRAAAEAIAAADERALELADLEAIYRRPAATDRNTRKETDQ